MTLLEVAGDNRTFMGLMAELKDWLIDPIDATSEQYFIYLCKYFYSRKEVFVSKEKEIKFQSVYDMLDEYGEKHNLYKLPNRELLEDIERTIGTTPLYILEEEYILDALKYDIDLANKVLNDLESKLSMDDIRTISAFLIKLHGYEDIENDKIELGELPSHIEKGGTTQWFDEIFM